MQNYPICIIKYYKNLTEAEIGLSLLQGAMNPHRQNRMAKDPAGFK